MTATFATELRAGFLRIDEVLTGRELQLLAHARDSLNRSREERNELLARIVLAYQRGPRQLWAPVLLDLLAPALIECLQVFQPRPPVVEEEDIRQQLVMEVLRAARCMPIHIGGRQMRIRLVTRASRSVVRWLEREGVHQARHCVLEDDQKDGTR